MNDVPNRHLSTGAQIPQVGFGLWQIKDPEAVNTSVAAALQAGYRHFDTAQIYGNEGFLADALNAAGAKRQDTFITTKISVTNFTKGRTKKSFEESLRTLQTDYVDLLLLHFPVPLLRHRAWHDLEDIYKAGQAKAIGVSNFTVRHLEKLLADCKVVPAVNQVELHVFLQQPELLAYCAEKGITVEAYSPLAHSHGLDDPTLVAIAQKHNKTSAQVMLRWCIEAGTIPLPKSVTPERIAQNSNIFDFSLDNEDMQKLKALDKGMRTCWDPTHIP